MQAVIFDLWETLITDAPELQRARQLWRATNLRTILDADGAASDVDILDEALGATLHGLSLMHDAGTDTDALGRVALFIAEYKKHGGASPSERLYEALETAICTMPEGLYPRRMEGAVETLSAIKAQGLRTGLVSNAGITTSPTLRAMLDHYGLLAHLDTLVFSDDEKLAKPSPAIFTAALDGLGCPASGAVFVGDSARHDIAGAMAVGLKTVQIGGRVVEGIEPDARIEMLAELPDVLAAMDPDLTSLNRAGG